MEQTIPKPFVFVLMPFASESEDIYQLGIKDACKEVGAFCERVDEQFFQESILERIYNQIAKADVIVSDMTGRNPNVFYETGYAHALGKRVILLTQHAEDIPFDLKHFSHVVYGGKIVDLKKELIKRLEWAIANPTKHLSQVYKELKYYFAGKEIKEGTAVEFNTELKSGQQTIRYSLDVHNPTTKICNSDSLEIGIILPEKIGEGLDTSNVRLPSKEFLYLLPKLGHVLPGAWRNVSLMIKIKQIDDIRGKKFPSRLRIFTEIGSYDINFTTLFR
jgi:hypothetical protein